MDRVFSSRHCHARSLAVCAALGVPVVARVVGWLFSRFLSWRHALPAKPAECWTLEDLPHVHHSQDFLFVYKHHDVHIDHPEIPVTLQTQLCHLLPELVRRFCLSCYHFSWYCADAIVMHCLRSD